MSWFVTKGKLGYFPAWMSFPLYHPTEWGRRKKKVQLVYLYSWPETYNNNNNDNNDNNNTISLSHPCWQFSWAPEPLPVSLHGVSFTFITSHLPTWGTPYPCIPMSSILALFLTFYAFYFFLIPNNIWHALKWPKRQTLILDLAFPSKVNNGCRIKCLWIDSTHLRGKNQF